MLAPAPKAEHLQDESTNIVQRRSRPHVVILTKNLIVDFAEPAAQALLNAPVTAGCRLPPDIEKAVCWMLSEECDVPIAFPRSDLLIRISILEGQTNKIALFVERYVKREDFSAAVRRYALTRRQVEVVQLTMGGLNASQIAARLKIAESTVTYHFKLVLMKTRAKNRTEVLAKVFGVST